MVPSYHHCQVEVAHRTAERMALAERERRAAIAVAGRARPITAKARTSPRLLAALAAAFDAVVRRRGAASA